MYTVQDIKDAFGEMGVVDFYSRVQFMEPKLRQEFLDACMKYKAHPGTSWNGGHFGDPFEPYYKEKHREQGKDE